jgi:isoleucyl-tRNA synthetase
MLQIDFYRKIILLLRALIVRNMDTLAKMNLPAINQTILQKWKNEKTFEKCLELSKDRPKFIFYDGPPFCTGLPHYGHLLASTIKDIFPRYKTQTGFHVDRVFGYDCIAEGTLINLKDGTSIPIEKFNDYSCQVETYNLKDNGFTFGMKSNYFNKGKKICIELTFLDNTKLVCTPDHQIYTTTGWVAAKDINTTMDIISTYCNPSLIDFYQDSNWSLNTDRINLSCSDIVEKRKSVAYVRLLGYMLADGCLFNNTSKKCIVSYVYLGHELDAQMFVEDIHLVTGFKPKYRFSRTVYVIDLPRCLVYSFASLKGIVVGKRVNQGNTIPDFIKESTTPKFLKQEFLAGLFGGDGHTTGLKGPKSGPQRFHYCKFSQSKKISMVTPLQELIHDVIKLLNDIGIDTITTQGPKETTCSKTKMDVIDKTYEYSLNISVKSMIDFASKVGFRYCIHKTGRLGITKSYLSHRATDTPKYKVDEWLKVTDTDLTMNRKYFIDRDQLLLPHYLTKVTSIKNMGEMNVYDLTVDNTHNFVANGIVVHNCHGLPIEYEIEKELGIKTKQQILDYGIDKYNDKCRGIVMKYEREWKSTIETLGRWVDYDNNWKTMDPSYMESVWWVFAQLYQKNRIYQGFKVMPYSIGCHTPLSNFEAQSNYKDVSDYSLTVKFPLTEASVSTLHQQGLDAKITKLAILVWTTTPWTLPSNLAICVSPKLDYCVILSKGELSEYLLMAKDCVAKYFSDPQTYEVVTTFQSTQLEGLTYTPLYNYYEEKYPHAFVIISDPYVGGDKGTGCVHQAPAYGEDDYRTCLKFGLVKKGEQPPDALDDDGCFTAVAKDYQGIQIKTAEVQIVKDLKVRGLVFKSCKEVHSYPHCWRSDLPLIYRAVPSWFVRVEDHSVELVDENKKINWSPEHIGTNRFGNWLASTQDWCVSRNRYWGTPLPVWTNADGSEMQVIQSVAQLEELTGQPKGSIKDLHIDSIQSLKVPSALNGTPLVFCGLTLDCWFESGCMPYAHQHYPFKQNDANQLPSNFPADFIAEGLDQTRGWFYTLHVISTALFNQPAFKNVIVNGLILAKDGKKMAKKLKNYPPPEEVLSKYGADVLRLYLIDSDVVQAEPMKFSETDLSKLIQTFFLPYHNSVSFLVEMMKYYQITNNKDNAFPIKHTFSFSDFDPIDLMMINSISDLITTIHSEMEAYRLNRIVKLLSKFIDQVSRVYIKLKKSDIKAQKSEVSLQVLLKSLWAMTQLLAPFAPFTAEHYYLHVFQKADPTLKFESIHFSQLPRQLSDVLVITNLADQLLVHQAMTAKFTDLLDLGHVMRDRLPFSYKRPIKSLTIVAPPSTIEFMQTLTEQLSNELNVLDIQWGSDDSESVDYQISADFKLLAQNQLSHVAKALGAQIKSDPQAIIQSLAKSSQFSLQDKDKEVSIPKEIFNLVKVPKQNAANNIFIAGEFSLIADLEYSPEIEYLFELRQLTRSLNDYRKQCNLTISDSSVTTLFKFMEPSEKLTLNWHQLQKDLYLRTKLILIETNLDVSDGKVYETYDGKVQVKILTENKN